MLRFFRQLLVILPPLAVSFALSALIWAQERTAPLFFDDDPIARYPETQDASKVQERPLSLYFDASINLFGRPGKPRVGRAASVNTIDEVPDSSWFVNRAGSRALTAEDVFRGPGPDTGPAPGRLLVSRKAGGVSAGFTVVDGAGARYFLKFDPPGDPELGSATEVIVTRLFHALGYHVPQAVIATIRAEDLEIGPDATVRTPAGGRRPMTRDDIDEVLERAHRNDDGSYRVVAAQALPGRPLEGFKYEGTRPDDPNDIIPHEDRRELRGLRVFSAWVNHTDAKAINSLDMAVAEDGRTIVRHHLIDFNAALGSAGVGPKEHRDGYEYLVETGPAKRALFAFGFAPREWMSISYPHYRGVGRLEAEHFDPRSWRPRVPNPAYVRSRPDDTFWAARKVMAMGDALIRAAVRAGRLGDHDAEQYLVNTLIERRDRIGRAWLTDVNPVIDPSLSEEGVLTFDNAAVQHAVAERPSGYTAVWHRFDNTSGSVQRIGETTSETEQIRAPAPLEGEFVRVDVSATGSPHRSWAAPVHAYFRRTAGAWKLVGFDRMPDAPEMRPGLVGAEPVAR
jgi:hypothetical protein